MLLLENRERRKVVEPIYTHIIIEQGMIGCFYFSATVAYICAQDR